MGKLNLPAGKKIAVNLGVDVDAQSLWLGGFNRPSPSFMSRGEFGAVVGMPRLLNLFKKYGVKTTFFTPGHTLETFPEVIKRALNEGHEIAHHGYYHENPTLINRDTEKRLQDLTLKVYKNILGIRPAGYRSPYWDYSDNTLDLIEEQGFLYDSSLMGRDFEIYRPQRWQVRWEKPNVAGPGSKVLEAPVSWFLDDFPPMAYTGAGQTGLQDTDAMFRRWSDEFLYCYEHVHNGFYGTAMHPQVIGQGHLMMFLERLIQFMMSFDGVWFASCEDICKCYVNDEEDKRIMALPEVRGVEKMPSDYGWK
jgi:peptidoglycan/xylan/chitin deacetylase (PgdA/CDA1 family)